MVELQRKKPAVAHEVALGKLRLIDEAVGVALGEFAHDVKVVVKGRVHLAHDGLRDAARHEAVGDAAFNKAVDHRELDVVLVGRHGERELILVVARDVNDPAFARDVAVKI